MLAPRTSRRVAQVLAPLLVALGALTAQAVAHGPAPHANGIRAKAAAVTGTKKVMVLRVHFNDYTATSRYSRATVQNFFDQDLAGLWGKTSYGKMGLATQVTDLYKLPDNRSAYVDDRSDGDLSEDAKYWKVLNDAIAAAPSGLDWTNLDAIMVVMAETSTSQFHRGQGTGECTLAQGPGGANASVGCAIFSENPSETDVANWGRWAHEIGHAFQENPTPAHPSNYNNMFELMDASMPGQTGVFSKQAGKAFTGWMPPDHYQDIVPDVSGSAPSWAPAGSAVGGALVNLKAMEYDPALAPNLQAARIYITQNLYYLVSVRRRILGDDLNDAFTPAGIPDEGVLLERVVEGGNTSLNDCAGQPTACPRWVEVKGPGGNANRLWRDGDNRYAGDGVVIDFKNIDADNWQIRVRYRDAAQPDVAVSPWRSPPTNTWESTDIWVDSPVNGYGTYRYGSITSLSGDSVPRGNGDDPAVGQRNRVYARVRNLGTQDASNVVVHLDRTDPEGRGINGSNGFTGLGTVTQADFPAWRTSPPAATPTSTWSTRRASRPRPSRSPTAASPSTPACGCGSTPCPVSPCGATRTATASRRTSTRSRRRPRARPERRSTTRSSTCATTTPSTRRRSLSTTRARCRARGRRSSTAGIRTSCWPAGSSATSAWRSSRPARARRPSSARRTSSTSKPTTSTISSTSRCPWGASGTGSSSRSAACASRPA
jgi:hypothetical protein